MKTTSTEIPRKWSWHHRALLRLRDTLAKESGERSAAARAGAERGGADRADEAGDEVEHNNLLAEIRQEQTELAEVDAALDRLRDGTYGVCAVSGKPIDAARLRALPWTRFSVEAAIRIERFGGASRPRG